MIDEMKYSIWQRPYRDATQETDAERVAKFVSEVEGAIFLRLQELVVMPNDEESRAIRAACDELLKIKTQRLGWPSWVDELREAPTDV
jgi:hypothetical protein